MSTIKEFDFSNLLKRISELQVQTIENIPADRLEWILSEFALSWGQRLPLKQIWMPELPPTTQELVDFYSPFSTAADFPHVLPRQINILSVVTACIGLHLMLLDYIIDEPRTALVAEKIALQPLLLHAYRLLNRLFSVDSMFWNEAERLLNLTSQTMLDEYRTYNGKVRPFSLSQFKRIACGKTAFMQINCTAMATLNNTPELIPVLRKCWDAIGLGITVRDDFKDWRKDYDNANYTYLLSQVLLSDPFKKDVEAGQLPEPEVISAALFCTDLLESLYELSYEELRTAATLATEINCLALAELIQGFQQTIKDQSVDILNRKFETILSMNTHNLQ
ncbi:MAG: hypothetical protein ACFFD4_33715 [Candidatus Odinarchaeota archaeon]